jgi:hypothetical protein
MNENKVVVCKKGQIASLNGFRDGYEKCCYCKHRYYHKSYECIDKWPMNRCCEEIDKVCEGVSDFDKCHKCEYFEKKDYGCDLTNSSPESGCIKGKFTVDDLIILFNRILPHVFAEGSNDMTNIGSAMLKYPNYRITAEKMINENKGNKDERK